MNKVSNLITGKIEIEWCEEKYSVAYVVAVFPDRGEWYTSRASGPVSLGDLLQRLQARRYEVSEPLCALIAQMDRRSSAIVERDLVRLREIERRITGVV